ncbi:hypothetical protein AQ484_16865 [Acinetobacter baumannii]|nr:hypothetical protein AQ484_16865 [Acinetobacter baumannii]
MFIKSILSSITSIIPLPENSNTSSNLGNGSGDGLLNGISSGMANTTMVLAMVLPMTQALQPQLPFPSTSLVTQLHS